MTALRHMCATCDHPGCTNEIRTVDQKVHFDEFLEFLTDSGWDWHWLNILHEKVATWCPEHHEDY